VSDERPFRIDGDPPRLVVAREEHRLLLRAACRPTPDAVDDWRAWKARVHLDDVGGDATRLLPLLATNLERLGVAEDADIAKCKGLRKYQWTENERRLAGLRAAADALEREGIRWIALRGVAVLAREPATGVFCLGLQEMLPLAKSDFRRAADVLAANGWTARDPRAAWRLHFTHPDGGELRLHATTLWDGERRADAALRANAKPDARFPGLAPAVEDLAPLVAALGFCQPEFPRVNWVAELRTLLDDADDLDWSTMLANAAERRMLRPFVAGIRFIEAELGLELSPSAQHALANARPTFGEQRLAAGAKASFALRAAARIERKLKT